MYNLINVVNVNLKKNEPDTKLYSTPSPNSFKPTNPCSNTNVCIESTRVDWQLDP